VARQHAKEVVEKSGKSDLNASSRRSDSGKNIELFLRNSVLTLEIFVKMFDAHHLSPEDGDGIFLRNVGIYRRVYTAPRPRRTASSSSSSSSPPSEPQTSQEYISQETQVDCNFKSFRDVLQINIKDVQALL
jgi:hypothetical protein